MTTFKNIAQFFKKHDSLVYALTMLAVALLFISFRVYRITETFFFFNDMGRDFLILLEWQESGRPPLLGPQTSALPFNQSALYFYLLYPIFFISKHSAYATVITNTLFYLASFLAGYFALRKRDIRYTLPFIGFLVAIHPQIVTQHRFIWNPSFTLAPLIAGIYSYLIMKKDGYDRKKMIITVFFFALASALSYSTVPILIAMLIMLFINYRSKIFEIILALGASLAVVNLPTIAFEIRHKFFLTSLLINGEKLSQIKTPFFDKFLQITNLSIYSSSHLANYIFVFAFVTTLVTLLILIHKGKANKSTHSDFLEICKILGITLIAMVFMPVSVQSHYVFPIVVLVIMAIAFLKHPAKYLLTFILIFIWFVPANSNLYMGTPPRTVEETWACAAKICDNEKQPMFVSTQAGYHPFHNGIEFQFLFKEQGCSIKKLDTEIDQASHMVVVVDGSEYEHGKTDYNELTQFGESSVVREYSCDGDMDVFILERNPILEKAQ